MVPRGGVVAAVAAVAGMLAGGVLGQQVKTTAICVAGFDWMTNSLGQSPCLVAAYLQSVCTYSNFTVQSLPSDEHYAGPDDPAESNLCQCNTVVYDLICGCAACQDNVWDNWSLWKINCSYKDTNILKFPLHIPVKTAIPSWAFYDPTTADTFNLTSARTLAGGADISSASTTAQKAAPPIGSIVGGAVGGAAVIALFVLVGVILCMRHRRRARVRQLSQPVQWDTPMSPTSPTSPASMKHVSGVPLLNQPIPPLHRQSLPMPVTTSPPGMPYQPAYTNAANPVTSPSSPVRSSWSNQTGQTSPNPVARNSLPYTITRSAPRQ